DTARASNKRSVMSHSHFNSGAFAIIATSWRAREQQPTVAIMSTENGDLRAKIGEALHPPSVIENLLWLPPVGTLAPSKGCLQEHRSSVCTENSLAYHAVSTPGELACASETLPDVHQSVVMCENRWFSLAALTRRLWNGEFPVPTFYEWANLGYWRTAYGTLRVPIHA